MILALSVVAIATIASATLVSQQHIVIQRSSNFYARDQALHYSLGAEQWAQLWLQRDAEDNDFDHEGEDWATELPPLPVDGGSIVAKLYDLQGQFNLNNLRSPDGEVNPLQLQRLKALFSAAGVQAGTADAVADWVDKNIEVNGSNGAEDDYYLGLEKPYRTPNGLIGSATEVRLLREMKQEQYDKLKDSESGGKDPRTVLSALPVTTTINVNTASSLVLKSLGLDEQTVTDIIEQRVEQPFETIDSFMNLSGVVAANIDQTGLDVKSRFFLLVVESTIARARSKLNSVIYRDPENGATLIVRRSYGTL